MGTGNIALPGTVLTLSRHSFGTESTLDHLAFVGTGKFGPVIAGCGILAKNGNGIREKVLKTNRSRENTG